MITPTKMVYVISRHGREFKRFEFTDWANLNTMTMFLHNGSVTPLFAGDAGVPEEWPAGTPYFPYNAHSIGNVRMFGLVKSIWVNATQTAKGPKLVCGMLLLGQ